MSMKIPSIEARAIIASMMAREKSTVKGHHRITTPIKGAAKTAREKLHILIEHLTKKLPGSDNEPKASQLLSMGNTEMARTYGIVEKVVGGELPSAPALPKVGKTAPRLLAVDCSFLNDCDEERPEEWAEIARKVQAAIAFAKHPASRIVNNDIGFHYHGDNQYIRYSRIDSQPRIIRQSSIRSQAAKIVTWAEDIVDEGLDTNFDLPELDSLESCITTSRASWSPPATAPRHSLAPKDSFFCEQGSSTPVKNSTVHLRAPIWQIDDIVPANEWEYPLF